MKCHDKVSTFKCSQCDDKFKTKNQLEKHMDDQHSRHIVKQLEEKISKLEDKCITIEAEKESLSKKLRDCNKSSSEEEETVLSNSKKNGFHRISPQQTSVRNSGEQKFVCMKCNCTLESNGLLNAHMQSQHSQRQPNSCDDCGTSFWTKIQLKNHTEMYHAKEENIMTKQYNCKDCSFQAENGLELKKHIRRTKHVPCDHIEQCYTCKKEFMSYWL